MTTEEKQKFIDRIDTVADRPHRIENGKKVYIKTSNINHEYTCIKYFFEAVNYDKEICEMVLDPKNSILRKEISEIGVPMMAIYAKSKIIRV